MPARLVWMLAVATLFGFVLGRIQWPSKPYVAPKTGMVGGQYQRINPDEPQSVDKVSGYDYIWNFDLPKKTSYRITEQGKDLVLSQEGDSLDVRWGNDEKRTDIRPLIERIRSCQDTSPVVPVPVGIRNSTLEFPRGTVTVKFQSLSQSCNGLGQVSNRLGGIALVKLK